jgi:DNA-binding response OmpR family regulator
VVVDNNPDGTDFIRQGLEYSCPAKYSVICVDSGKKCFELLERSDSVPDIILLEITMSDMNGWEIFDRLKSNPRWGSIPIVFMSGRTDRVAQSAGSFLGEDYIVKPFEIMDLKERIDKVLKQN